MNNLRTLALVLGLAAAASAQAPTVKISIGIRETGFNNGVGYINIGANGGTAGGIEWVNRDGQTLTLDGTWQQFTFNIATDPITAFAGTSANGIVEGTYGVLEHIRILNDTGITAPFTIHLDDVTNRTQTLGAVNFGDFQGFTTGQEVIFQEPSFSGSTSANLLPGSTAGVDNLVASRTSAYKFAFTFIDNLNTRWLRLTTFGVGGIVNPNPQIRFDDQSQVTFWMRGGVCQEDLGSQGPGSAIAEACGTGLSSGQSSTYYTAQSPANALGVMAISVAGQPDLPIFGGNLVSGFGLAATVTIAADSGGRFSLALNPFGSAIDLVLQTAFLDLSQTQGLTFTNALKCRFGR